MTILVTGVAGQIGIHLTLNLLKEGKSVIGVDNLSSGSKSFTQWIPNQEKFTFVEGSIEDPQLYEKLHAHPIESIYHLACPVGVDKVLSHPEEMMMALTMGTKRVFAFAKEKKVPCLLASSSEIYGNSEQIPEKESYMGNVNPLHKRAVYQEGKRFAETIASLYYWKYGVPAKIVRIFNCYGPYFSPDDQRAVPAFVRAALKNKPLTCFGNGSDVRAFCYVDDLIEALKLVMKKGVSGEAYNLGNPEKATVNELMQLILQLTGSKSPIEYQKARDEEVIKRIPDITKLKKLGFHPKIPLQEGLKKTIEVMRDAL